MGRPAQARGAGLRAGLGLIWLTLSSLGCGGTAPWQPPPVDRFPQQVGWSTPRSVGAGSASVKAGEQGCRTATSTSPRALPVAGQRVALDLERSSLELGAGRWAVKVAVPPQRYVTIGVAGPPAALLGFQVVGDGPLRRLRSGAVEDDGLLPTFVSFQTTAAEHSLTVVVDVQAPVTLLRASSDPADIGERSRRDLRLGKVQPRALVGLPLPIERRAGYLLQAPPRYVFVRADVAAALRAALRQTRIRFKSNAIGIGDATQWNGDRPATDRGKPRHIHHAEGREVDIGLPSSDDSASLLRRRCEGVLVERDELKCAPGTVRDLDVRRLAYFLSLLIDGPTPGGRHVADAARRPGPLAVVETILTDQAYIDEIRKALPALRRKRWIHDEAYGALGEEGLLRPSSWHVDHLHIQFQGERADVPAVLRFQAEPSPAEQKAAGPTGG